MRQVDDPLLNAGLEEEVLSTMMAGAKVTSLEEDHFTSPVRAKMYTLMRKGVAYDDLVKTMRATGSVEEDLYYPVDVYTNCPTIPKGARMKEAVEELKRLHKIRLLCAAVDAWRRRAPALSLERALADLQACTRSILKD